MLNSFTKNTHLLKKYPGQMPFVAVMSGREKEEKPPHLPTPRRAALAISRQKIKCLPSERTTGADKIFFLHVPGKSSYECKVQFFLLKSMPLRRPHKYSEARSGGKTKRNKTVEFDIRVKESKIMEHDAPITKKKK